MPFTEYAQFANHTATLPDIALRLREILDDPATDANAIGDLIGIDPALSAKVLRLANSALFRFPAQIDNIARAVNVVGGEAIYMLVMAETAKKLQSQFTTDLVNNCMRLVLTLRCSVAQYISNGSYQYSYMHH